MKPKIIVGVDYSSLEKKAVAVEFIRSVSRQATMTMMLPATYGTRIQKFWADYGLIDSLITPSPEEFRAIAERELRKSVKARNRARARRRFNHRRRHCGA